MSDTLKDFLISVGFKVDTTGQGRVIDATKKTEAQLTQATRAALDKRRIDEEKATAKRIEAAVAAGDELSREEKATAEKITRRQIAEEEKRDRASAAAQEKEQKRRAEADKKEKEQRSKALKDAQSFVLKMAAFATKAAVAVEASALGVVYAVDKAAKSFERLSYMSQRTGSSPGRIGAFGYASSQLGSSPEEANSSLEAFGQKLRTNGSGYAQALERLGIKARDANGHLRDSADLATDLGDALRHIQERGGQYGYSNAVNQASVFGFDENTTRALMNPEFRKREGEYQSDQKKIGADPDAAAKSGTAFEQSMRRLSEVLDQIGTKISGVLFEKLKPLLDQLADWFAKNGDRISDIISRVADDLVKLAKAIADKIAGADWTAILKNIEELARAFDEIAGKLTSETGLTALFTAFGAVLAFKVLGPLRQILIAMRLLSGLFLPPWLLGMLGIGATAVVAGDAAKATFDKGFNTVSPGANAPGVTENQHMSAWDRAKKIWHERPAWMGGHPDEDGVPLEGNNAFRTRGTNATNARRKAGAAGVAGPETTTPGVYRPQYPLSNADLSDSVVNTIAGEARNNKESTDAVINNMLNRIGTSTYGPSSNMQDVARAPGQYTGYKLASPKQAEFIRERIRAIARGGVPDNTGGSNEYRAGTYAGPWARRHADAPIVGGNRFAYNPKGGRGTYSPYEHPRNYSPYEPSAPLPAPPPLQGAPNPYVPGQPQGFKGGGYKALGLDASGRPIRLGDTPALHQSINSTTRGDTSIVHNPTFNITGSDGPSTLEAARRMASRGNQDLLRNLQGAEQ